MAEQSVDIFTPVKYSLEECQFLLDHLGEPPSVALSSIKAVPNPNPPRNKDGQVIDKNPVIFPDGVIPASVKPILQRVYELEDLRVKFKQEWLGLDKLKVCIQVYLDQQKKWMDDKRKFPRAPRFPSMHSYDGKNRPHRGGPGSDSGMVRTYFDKQGNRLPFQIHLLDNVETGGWAPEWVSKKDDEPIKAAPQFDAMVTKKIITDNEHNRLECPICHHTESFRDDSSGSFNVARARMSKHLRTAQTEVTLHRELHTNEFGD